MTKRNLDWTLEKYNRFIKEGRGKGEGRDYKPWLTIQDMPSRGRVTRIYEAGRIYHFFTDNELRYFYSIIWQEAVIDVREHYPLLDLNRVLNLDEDSLYEKYRNDGDNAPHVLTTTFLITVKNIDGKINYYARSVKSSLELDKKNIIDRYEIQRRYYEAKKINWGIVTQKDIPVVRAKNISWVYPSLEINNDERFKESERECLCDLLMRRLDGSPNVIREVTTKFDYEMNFESGTGLLFFKYLIATKQLLINMDEEININQPISKVILNRNKGEVINDKVVGS
ncbi:TnsA endonuclease C-terminal domain-containing protein [Clostridium estertheticum]|uniref:TnsA endonuclease C-terminal domain-containing protein n=1 Tax=Clostridium estertheticum TaxID=238834 RepID=UPI0013E943A2|nr:TnsA endonuclease C-terminal domain-containing protein [Clostridium estertheticum]MBZ9689342.1 TnsA endonuclease C-terminal domain-containing protein [Clostridium estertheticum]